MNAAVEKDDKTLEKELTRHWLRPGERLLFGCAPIHGYVLAQIAAETRHPHEPLRQMPTLKPAPCLWPLPAKSVLDHWTDDPTVGFFVQAQHQDQHAVHFGDHLAHSKGEARLVLSSQRISIVYPTNLLHAPAPGAPRFTTFCELPVGQVRGLSAPFAGRSVPPVQVIGVDFVDGSTLHLRDPLAGLLVHRAQSR
ncbi:hypothetical protein [Actinomadura sp. HBU206391]|uniref:hypothetical protein n=1 Tax=Actinomadura sp. HBU206391 TaxID=2731692 RepID=UPI00164F6FBB|nr:hypothetical protein [Actinomadura sp. HBU206391]MBC6456666.1 hypothetical protein [Actinomadura sp. HBU206391]